MTAGTAQSLPQPFPPAIGPAITQADAKTP
jgi:hypothetical protein